MLEGKTNIFMSLSRSQCRNRARNMFENRSTTNVLMVKENFEYKFCISKGDNPCS